MFSKWLFQRDNLASKMNAIARENVSHELILKDILLQIEESAKKGKFSLNYPIGKIKNETLIGALMEALRKEGFFVTKDLVWGLEDISEMRTKMPSSRLCLIISWGD